MTILVTRSLVRCACHDKDRWVDAECQGGLALHEDVCGSGYTLTHIASGYRLAWMPTEVEARAARTAALAFGIDWTQPLAIWTAVIHRQPLQGKRIARAMREAAQEVRL